MPRDTRGQGPGVGRLHVIARGAQSVVSQAYAASPLKWLTPRNHGRAAWVYAATYGGGLVDGDALEVTVVIGPGATAFLSTQASTKVYRSPRGTRSDLAARVAGGGLLVSVPDPVVCFAHARYRQVQVFDLEADANLIVLDWLSAGRRARGERWAFDEYRSQLRIRYDGRLLCHEGVTLSAADRPLGDRLGRFDALATIALVGPRLLGEAERLLALHAEARPERHAHRYQVAAPLGGVGCLVRITGTSLEDVGRAVRACLRDLSAVLGDDPWARKW